MDEQIREQPRRLVRQGDARRIFITVRDCRAGGEHRRVTQAAAHRREHGRAMLSRDGRLRRHGRTQHAHEIGETFHVRQHCGIRRRQGAERGRVVGCHIPEPLAGRGLVPLLGKDQVGNAHFDVVGLGGEQQQRFVLGLPAEARDGAVIAAAIRVSRHAEQPLGEGVGAGVGEDRGIGNRLDQTRAQQRSRDAIHDVGVSALTGESIPRRRKARLRDLAAGRVAAVSDDEQIVDAAVGNEARLADRSVRHDEPGHCVGRAIGVGDGGQRIDEGTAAADDGLYVTGRAGIRVEARAEAAVVAGRTADHLDRGEAREAILKEGELVGRQACERRRRTVVGACLAHPGIDDLCHRRRGQRARGDQQCGQRRVNCRVVQAHRSSPQYHTSSYAPSTRRSRERRRVVLPRRGHNSRRVANESENSGELDLCGSRIESQVR